MDILNDDCQLLIIKYLKLKDQLSLFEATKGERSNRLNSNLRFTWQHQLGFTLDMGQFKVFDEKPELLNDFLSIISPKVQQLALWGITTKRLQSWTHYKFPEMRSLDYVLSTDLMKHDPYTDCNDEYSYFKEPDVKLVIQLIAQLFPELNTLNPDSPFDLIHLTNWMDLRKLDLGQCRTISRTDELGKISEEKSATNEETL
ncbi:uncharacterized protein LOC117779953 [Drosophila innubila]|uniref:uncharacterized protein LOC117779953 n=1 Tax=Drosophila innubila TaxID=198719 RepID=UPI00148D5C88|nr:uncharacterized protein LOC117779953 [Drosophila innubila]